MAHTFEELRKKTVAQLREIASGIEHEAVQGYTQLNKEHLLIAICKALKIDTFQHHHVEGVNKTEIKTKIKEFKKKRDELLESHDLKQLKIIRHKIHRLKRTLHKATV